MQANGEPDVLNDRKSRLRELIQDALDVAAYAPDVPITTVDFIADTIIKRAPTVDELAGIIGQELQAAGEGAGQTAEAAGEVAQAIAEGLGNVLSS
jgi:hypothetical protein